MHMIALNGHNHLLSIAGFWTELSAICIMTEFVISANFLSWWRSCSFTSPTEFLSQTRDCFSSSLSSVFSSLVMLCLDFTFHTQTENTISANIHALHIYIYLHLAYLYMFAFKHPHSLASRLQQWYLRLLIHFLEIQAEGTERIQTCYTGF